MFNIKTPYLVASHVLRRSGTAWMTFKSKAAAIGIDTADGNRLKYRPSSTGVASILDSVNYGQTFTKGGILTENGAGTSYTLSFTIPALAVLKNVRVIAKALWNGTSASLKVGDTADDDGYFVGVDLKATDLLVGEVLSAEDGDLWGGKNGAYLVAASGRRGPTTSNFGQYYEAGSVISFIVTPGAADGSAGRTYCEVEYALPALSSQVTV